MEYKVGDKVRVKSEDWYKQMLSIPNKLVWQNQLTNDFVGVWCGSHIFKESMFEFLGKTMTIQEVGIDFYLMEEDTCGYEFNDEMIEGLVEEETKPKFKVGDKIISDVLQLKWKVIDVERTGYRLISVNNSDLICDMDFENEQYYKLVEEEMKSEDELLDEYEELIDRTFKGGYEKCKSDIELNGFQLPEGYQFVDENGNVINATKIVLEKKKEHPKTFLGCCDVLGIGNLIERGVKGYKAELFDTLQKLYICRDAYWKIAGDEMGLGKPWEPDWNDEEQDKYGFHNEVKYTIINSAMFVFPTPEMRDAFYENFKKEIEICKEL